ncbi:MAG TPA: hypothetical protein VFK03_04770, partial [Candidatus Saccharimonadales bacterium]|nr:hypothetical protein [Candidatus Saccharimonadales bacterium]
SGQGADDEWDIENCEDFMRHQVSPEAAEALTYACFYRDGSVDSEFTFTLPLDKAEYAIEFIKAFKALANAIGNGLDTDGAGMHIAILNSEDGNYPNGNELDEDKFDNFRTAMQPLLPALYFLASADPKSRSLSYRGPQVSLNGKYSAIYGVRGHCLEFRVFETCYDKPEAFYDYLIVIANCLEFYKDEPTDTRLNIGRLGIKDGSGLSRFYYTEKHLDALHKGLKWLKPEYKTIKQLNQERGLVTTKAHLRQQQKRVEEKWREEYASFKQRLAFEEKVVFYGALSNGYQVQTSAEEARAYARAVVAEWKADRPTTLRKYLEHCRQQQQSDGVTTLIEV